MISKCQVRLLVILSILSLGCPIYQLYVQGLHHRMGLLEIDNRRDVGTCVSLTTEQKRTSVVGLRLTTAERTQRKQRTIAGPVLLSTTLDTQRPGIAAPGLLQTAEQTERKQRTIADPVLLSTTLDTQRPGIAAPGLLQTAEQTERKRKTRIVFPVAVSRSNDLRPKYRKSGKSLAQGRLLHRLQTEKMQKPRVADTVPLTTIHITDQKARIVVPETLSMYLRSKSRKRSLWNSLAWRLQTKKQQRPRVAARVPLTTTAQKTGLNQNSRITSATVRTIQQTEGKQHHQVTVIPITLTTTQQREHKTSIVVPRSFTTTHKTDQNQKSVLVVATVPTNLQTEGKQQPMTVVPTTLTTTQQRQQNPRIIVPVLLTTTHKIDENQKSSTTATTESTNQQNERKQYPLTTTEQREQKPMIVAPNFLYLTQTEKCLSKRLLAKQNLGSPEDCNCEVMVLSFRERCNDNGPPHVAYVFESKISWTVGRNRLYSQAMARRRDYLYYIFMDDDIKLGYNKGVATEDIRLMPPIRAFERFLVDNEPAVGVPNYQGHHTAEEMLNKRRDLCRNWTTTNANLPLHIPTTHYDAAFNAFHRDAIAHILPYSTKYDSTSWWYSQRYVIAVTELKFRGHAWMYAPVLAFNTKHRSYPRDNAQAGTVNAKWSYLVRDVVQTMPVEYRGRSLVRQFINDPSKYTENSLSVCFDYKPHYPIIPYTHFSVFN